MNGESWSVEGAWEEDGSIGPQQEGSDAGAAVVRLEDGSVATFSTQLPFDHLNTYCATAKTTGVLSIRIDDVAQGTACALPTNDVEAHAVASARISEGIHAVTFTCSGSCLLYGAEGALGESGISIHNLAVSSATAEWFGKNAATELAFLKLIPGGVHLVITDLLTNDAGSGYPVAGYTKSMQNIIAADKTVGAQTLIVVPPVSQAATASRFAVYTEGLLSTTSALSVPVANIQSSWGLTFNASSGDWSPDGIHPNTLGSFREYTIVAPSVHIE